MSKQPKPGRIHSFIKEARRRRLHTSAAAYIGLSIILIELGGAIFDALLLPHWSSRLLTIFLLLGFPVVLVLAWVFDIGPGGIQRTSAVAEGTDTQPAAPAGISWSGAYAAKQEEAPAAPIVLIDEAPDHERVARASLAYVRHELKTPINAIIGYSEMLLEDAQEEGDAAAAADLTRIRSCGGEILKLVDSILDSGRIAEEQGRDLASYGEQIRADLRDPLGAVTGYTEMLLEASREQGRTARVADLERMLSASHKLLELSNDIAALATNAPNAALSEIAKGATLAEGALSKIRAVQANSDAPDRHGSLLVVDDSAMNRDLLAKQLARKGYFVTTAESGEDAIERMAEQQFDLVLLDVLMPGLDGIGVLLRMKNDARLRDMPVIMISALDEIHSVVRCLELGAADFVSKPFHPTLLDARINTILTANAARLRGRAHGTHGDDVAMSRVLAGTLPDYVVQRIRKGETRLLDGAAKAVVYFVDIDYAVAASDPAQRAALTETLIESARRTSAQEGAIVLLQGIGLVIVAGFPQPHADAAERAARAALKFSKDAERAGVRLRSALHAGEVYAAVVGSEALSYWVWGDGIDLARRLALSAERGRISVSASCYALLKDHFAIASRGVIEVAGRGQMRAYVLEGEAAIAQ
jgi:DNA-binding response OmpR family regulator